MLLGNLEPSTKCSENDKFMDLNVFCNLKHEADRSEKRLLTALRSGYPILKETSKATFSNSELSRLLPSGLRSKPSEQDVCSQTDTITAVPDERTGYW
jgi:hypothetical protein